MRKDTRGPSLVHQSLHSDQQKLKIPLSPCQDTLLPIIPPPLALSPHSTWSRCALVFCRNEIPILDPHISIVASGGRPDMENDPHREVWREFIPPECRELLSTLKPRPPCRPEKKGRWPVPETLFEPAPRMYMKVRACTGMRQRGRARAPPQEDRLSNCMKPGAFTSRLNMVTGFLAEKKSSRNRYGKLKVGDWVTFPKK